MYHFIDISSTPFPPAAVFVHWLTVARRRKKRRFPQNLKPNFSFYMCTSKKKSTYINTCFREQISICCHKYALLMFVNHLCVSCIIFQYSCSCFVLNGNEHTTEKEENQVEFFWYNHFGIQSWNMNVLNAGSGFSIHFSLRKSNSFTWKWGSEWKRNWSSSTMQSDKRKIVLLNLFAELFLYTFILFFTFRSFWHSFPLACVICRNGVGNA